MMTLDVPVRRWITDHDRHQFRAEGYMVIRNVVPAGLAGNAVREIAAFVGADLSDPSPWDRFASRPGRIVPTHHAQSLWDLRQHLDLYQVFAEFFGTPRLMVDINR